MFIEIDNISINDIKLDDMAVISHFINPTKPVIKSTELKTLDPPIENSSFEKITPKICIIEAIRKTCDHS